MIYKTNWFQIFLVPIPFDGFSFSAACLPPCHSTRCRWWSCRFHEEEPRIDMDSATLGKLSVQNAHAVKWDIERKIQFILPKERKINRSLNQCLLQLWTGSVCRMTSRGGDRMEDETSSIEVSAKNDVKWHDWNSDVCMIFVKHFKV